ncbi:MAG: hypothetical protein ACOCRX_05935 [Candidatus Woesearchaeota archaeon]
MLKIWEFLKSFIKKDPYKKYANVDMSDVASEFKCNCGKMKGWIQHNKKTKFCPICGRKYIGKYNDNTCQIDPIPI